VKGRIKTGKGRINIAKRRRKIAKERIKAQKGEDSEIGLKICKQIDRTFCLG
jgi:hypothetical protein